MDIISPQNKLTNRRRAFRIYEPVDLFYQKVNKQGENGTHFDLPESLPDTKNTDDVKSIADQPLPTSKVHENDALNINISNSGASFTCKEKLKPGDSLILRILLLSNMTVVTVSCKVIYCKNSNPFEKDRYPYLIGVCFVNISPEDTELLNKYINKKRRQQFAFNSLLATLLITAFVFPEIIFDFFIGLFNLLIEYFTEAIHLLFELIEYNLDHLIEFLFHTNVHNTQVIVFYIILVLGLLGLYALTRVAASFCIKQWHNYRIFMHRKKSSFLYCWRGKPLIHKIGIISAVIIASACYVMFFI